MTAWVASIKDITAEQYLQLLHRIERVNDAMTAQQLREILDAIQRVEDAIKQLGEAIDAIRMQ